MKRRLYIILLITNTLCAFAQKATISGYVREQGSQETQIGAAVLDSISGAGCITNVSGFYSLTLPVGEITLRCSYMGFQPANAHFTLTKDTVINFQLSTLNYQLQEVTVVGNQSNLGVEGTQMSAIAVPVAQIKNIPAIAGEVDILKALQLLPGVQGGTEGSAGMYVRGGGPDENLIILDGVPLYNVNHMMGFFSVFNADAIKSVTLYKGDFPARFGSRLSSVIDVRQNEGNAQSYHGSVSVGLLSAKFNVEGPIVKGKTTFNISGRRTYYDILAQPIIWALAAQDDMHMTVGYYFWDVNAKLTHRFSDKDKLTASFYMGDDKIYFHSKDKWEYSQNGGKEIDTDKMDLGWRWGNLLAAANWDHQFTAKLYSHLNLAYTQYNYKLSLGVSEKSEFQQNGQTTLLDNYSIDMAYRSHINDLSASYTLDYIPNPKHDVQFGAVYTWHQFRPEVGSVTVKATDEEDSEQSLALNTGGNITHTHEASIYAEDNWSIHRIFKLNYGLRGSLYNVEGKTYPSIEPRVGLRVLLHKDVSFKASYSYMTQYLHLLSNSNITLPTDLWVPVTSRIKPMHSHQAAAGLCYDVLGQVELSLEGYYKTMDNQLEYKDGASFLSFSNSWEDKVTVGKGWSYGVEFLAQRKLGKVTGWLGYTWSRAMRQFDEINSGKPFHAKYDREHDLSLAVNWQVTPKIELAGTFIFSTGSRATLGTQVYYPHEEDDPRYWWVEQTEYIPERNNYVMPAYHRLDIGATFHKPHKKWAGAEHLFNVSVYNVYNQLNPFMVYPRNNKLYKVSLFPILPSFTYTFKF